MIKIKALLAKIVQKLNAFDAMFYKATVSGNSSVNFTWSGTLHANLTITSASSGRLGVCAVYGNSAGTAVQTSTLPSNVTVSRTASNVLTVTNSGSTSIYLRFLIFDGGLA